MRRIFGHGRYANVTATLALVIALGGTAWAAATITGKDVKNNSLTGADIRNNTIASADVRNGSLTTKDLHKNVLAAAKGPKGDKGDKGDPGPPGAPGTGTGAALPSQLSSGQTLRGHIQLAAAADLASESVTESVSFAVPLPAAIAPANAHFIAFGGAVPAGCAGGTPANPVAAGGFLCVFETSAGANTTGRTLEVTRFGFSANAQSSGAGNFGYTASWAVTAG